jgi:hypothetical protein
VVGDARLDPLSGAFRNVRREIGLVDIYELMLDEQL